MMTQVSSSSSRICDHCLLAHRVRTQAEDCLHFYIVFTPIYQ
jgi:hypothetical protein